MTAMPLANWNGEILPLDQVKVSVLDRAFLFGDAVYEAMRIYAGRVFLLERHWARLAHSLSEMQIAIDLDRLRQRLADTLGARPVADGLVYIQITRGADQRRSHYFPAGNVLPNELLWIQPYVGDPHLGERSVGVPVVSYPDLRWQRRDIKTVNLLGNVFAAQKAHQSGAAEAILIDAEGNITEGSHTSVFAVQDGKLLTSPLGRHILPGVTRGFVLELARQREVAIDERPIRFDQRHQWSEFFLTGTSTEVLAVRAIDGTPVGSEPVGPITKRLADAYRAAVDRWLAEGSTT